LPLVALTALSVNIDSGLNIRVAQQLLLDGKQGTQLVQQRRVCLTKGVPSDLADSSSDGGECGDGVEWPGLAKCLKTYPL
jgi:hypothetical protein